MKQANCTSSLLVFFSPSLPPTSIFLESEQLTLLQLVASFCVTSLGMSISMLVFGTKYVYLHVQCMLFHWTLY